MSGATLDLGPEAPHRCPDAVYTRGLGWKAPRCVVCDAAWEAHEQAPVQAAALAAQGAMFTDLAPTPKRAPQAAPEPDPYDTAPLF